MKDMIRLSMAQYDVIMHKTLEADTEFLGKEFKGICLPQFGLDIYGDIFGYIYTYDYETKLLKVEVYNKYTKKKATFKTVMPFEITWGGTNMADIEWEEGSNQEIREYYSELATLAKNEKIPELIRTHCFKYQGLLMQFEHIQKALYCLPTIWRKETFEKEKIASTSEERLIRAIYGKKVTLQNVYTIKCSLDALRNKEFKNYVTFKCPCWGVRGHIRHLKNGKEVFVKAYKKGEKRGNSEAYMAKEYEIKE